MVAGSGLPAEVVSTSLGALKRLQVGPASVVILAKPDFFSPGSCRCISLQPHQ